MSRKKHSKSKRRNRRTRKPSRSAYSAPPVQTPRATPAKRPGMSTNNKLVTGAMIVIAVLIGVGWIADYETPTASLPSLPATPMTSTGPGTTATPSIVVIPTTIIQGDPVMITVPGLTTSSKIESGTVGSSPGTPLFFTMYQGVPTAFFGANINHALGPVTVMVVLSDNSNGGKIAATKRLTTTFTVRPRVRPTEPLPVPAQVGGNSAANQLVVADTLDTENAEIDAIPSAKTAFWTTAFAYPIHPADETDSSGAPATTLKITDPYGFNRDSGEVTIPHMGIDFKAASGTPVYAINDGVVRLTKTFVEYGNTVIVDHGLGIESLYMHLSRIVATPGEVMKKGELIGYSGETGYAVGPHLHLSIKINGISIDPQKFFALFGLPALPVVDTGGAD